MPQQHADVPQGTPTASALRASGGSVSVVIRRTSDDQEDADHGGVDEHAAPVGEEQDKEPSSGAKSTAVTIALRFE